MGVSLWQIVVLVVIVVLVLMVVRLKHQRLSKKNDPTEADDP